MLSLIIMAVVGFLILSLFVFLVSGYNKGIYLRNYVREAFSTMDVYLKKRWDLIPNLLESVKGYSEHEKGLFSKITELRNQNYSGLNNDQKIDLNSQLGFGLSKLLAVVENYPELKANQNFMVLMEQLTQIEDDIANSRKYYNGTVRELNTYTELFPSNIICMMFGIKQEKLFEINEGEKENVKVTF